MGNKCYNTPLLLHCNKKKRGGSQNKYISTIEQHKLVYCLLFFQNLHLMQHTDQRNEVLLLWIFFYCYISYISPLLLLGDLMITYKMMILLVHIFKVGRLSMISTMPPIGTILLLAGNQLKLSSE